MPHQLSDEGGLASWSNGPLGIELDREIKSPSARVQITLMRLVYKDRAIGLALPREVEPSKLGLITQILFSAIRDLSPIRRCEAAKFRFRISTFDALRGRWRRRLYYSETSRNFLLTISPHILETVDRTTRRHTPRRAMNANKSRSVQKVDVQKVDIQLNADIPQELQKPRGICRRRRIKLSLLGFGRFEQEDTWTTLEECKDNSDE
jgi:hypothetical protein